MELNEAIKKVGLTVASLQSQKVTHISRQLTRSFRSDNFNGIKAIVATNNDAYWELTSAPSIHRTDKFYRITLLQRRNARSLKAQKRKYSAKFENRIDAEKNLFNFRMSHESKKSRILVNEKIKELVALDKPMEAVYLSGNTSLSDLTGSDSSNERNIGGVWKKRREMSLQKVSLHEGRIASRNPACAGELNVYSVRCTAIKLQTKIRNFLSQRRKSNLNKKLYQKQKEVLSKLQKQLAQDTVQSLIVSGQDKEYFLSLSEYQKNKIKEQG